jgi:hypothetical protein
MWKNLPLVYLHVEEVDEDEDEEGAYGTRIDPSNE